MINDLASKYVPALFTSFSLGSHGDETTVMETTKRRRAIFCKIES